MKKETTWIWIGVGLLAFWFITRRYVWPLAEGFQAAAPPCPSETIAGKKTWLCASDQAVVRLKSSGLVVADDQICVDNGDSSNRVFFCKDRSVPDPSMEDDVRFEMMDLYESSCTKLLKAYTDLSGASDAKLREKGSIDTAIQGGLFSVASIDAMLEKYACNSNMSNDSLMKSTCDVLKATSAQAKTSYEKLKTTQDQAFSPLLNMEEARLNGLRRLIELKCLTGTSTSNLTNPAVRWRPLVNGRFIKTTSAPAVFWNPGGTKKRHQVKNCTACPQYYSDVCTLTQTVPDTEMNTLETGPDFTCTMLAESISPV
jgi:hypothetical protein